MSCRWNTLCLVPEQTRWQALGGVVGDKAVTSLVDCVHFLSCFPDCPRSLWPHLSLINIPLLGDLVSVLSFLCASSSWFSVSRPFPSVIHASGFPDSCLWSPDYTLAFSRLMT